MPNKPFIVFTAEDFPFHRMDDCKNGCPESCHAVIAASRANAILNERGTRMYTAACREECCVKYEPHTVGPVSHLPSENDTHEALLLGQREIEK